MSRASCIYTHALKCACHQNATRLFKPWTKMSNRVKLSQLYNDVHGSHYILSEKGEILTNLQIASYRSFENPLPQPGVRWHCGNSRTQQHEQYDKPIIIIVVVVLRPFLSALSTWAPWCSRRLINAASSCSTATCSGVILPHTHTHTHTHKALSSIISAAQGRRLLLLLLLLLL